MKLSLNQILAMDKGTYIIDKGDWGQGSKH